MFLSIESFSLSWCDGRLHFLVSYSLFWSVKYEAEACSDQLQPFKTYIIFKLLTLCGVKTRPLSSVRPEHPLEVIETPKVILTSWQTVRKTFPLSASSCCSHLFFTHTLFYAVFLYENVASLQAWPGSSCLFSVALPAITGDLKGQKSPVIILPLMSFRML